MISEKDGATHCSWLVFRPGRHGQGSPAPTPPDQPLGKVLSIPSPFRSLFQASRSPFMETRRGKAAIDCGPRRSRQSWATGGYKTPPRNVVDRVACVSAPPPEDKMLSRTSMLVHVNFVDGKLKSRLKEKKIRRLNKRCVNPGEDTCSPSAVNDTTKVSQNQFWNSRDLHFSCVG